MYLGHQIKENFRKIFRLNNTKVTFRRPSLGNVSDKFTRYEGFSNSFLFVGHGFLLYLSLPFHGMKLDEFFVFTTKEHTY